MCDSNCSCNSCTGIIIPNLGNGSFYVNCNGTSTINWSTNCNSCTPCTPTVYNLAPSCVPCDEVVDPMQVYTSGTTVTLSNLYTGLYVDPVSVISSLQITLKSIPTPNERIIIIFGGTITSGNPVITALSIVSSFTIFGTLPTSAVSGDSIEFEYRQNKGWYKIA